MRRRTFGLAALCVVFLAMNAAAANDQLVAALKTLGKAVDNMSVNLSNTETHEEAELIANATRQTLANGLKYDGLKVDVKATPGFCRVTLETPAWILWSESQSGRIIDHGATIH